MSAVSTMCQCCQEETGKLHHFDPDLGTLCKPCADGVRYGIHALSKAKIQCVFIGKCGDNERRANP